MPKGLTLEELEEFDSHSVDRIGTGRYINRHENVDLTDEELIERIKARNETKEPTYKLRMEYQRRLNQRG